MTNICAAPGCTNHVRRNRSRFCCIPCARPKTQRFCLDCGAKTPDHRSVRCKVCAVVHRRLYGPEVIQRIRDLRGAGVGIKEVGAQLGMKLGTVRDLIVRHGIKWIRAAPAPKPPRPRPPRAARSIVVRSTTPKPRAPIAIPLREIYRLGFELSVPLARRGDVDVVSRAMRRSDPTHPGFRIETRSGTRPMLGSTP